MSGGAQDFFVSESSPRINQTLLLNASVSCVKAVAGKRLQALNNLGITTVLDLLLHLPHRYLDYTKRSSIAAACLGEETTIVGMVDRIKNKATRRFLVTEVYLLDDTGVLRLTFFRQPWLSQQLTAGDILAVSGKVKFSYGYKEMTAPFWEKVADHAAGSNALSKEQFGRVIPVHRLTQEISAAWMRRILINALEEVRGLLDFMPSELVVRHGLLSEGVAYERVHFPETLQEAEEARRRLAYDELICLQIALRARQVLFGERAEGRSHTIEGPHMHAFQTALPFSLTSEQTKAVAEILNDMQSAVPMNRLLLGDVGTGKTVVAAHALAVVADSGTQAAVMVPTSVLATQYAEKVGPLLDKANISWALLTGTTTSAERAKLAADIQKGAISVVFGTQALISKDIVFPRLSLVIVDEQHRFGVEQRARISEKGKLADMLTMTATPIPRTLALALYGDVTVSRITKRPNPGAGTTTQVITPENLDVAWGGIVTELEAGHQAYIVCPLIEEGEEQAEGKRKLHSAETVYARVSKGILKNWRVGLLTGDMKAGEKEEVMAAFKAHDLDVLVATTIIEVGVDVLNATALLVFDADRFGLATLHQLRGRVGRGNATGHVYLETPYTKQSAARKRLQALATTNDGFKLAELDLKLRHEGDIVGSKQSGGTTLAVADLDTDKDLIEAAYADISELLAIDPLLQMPEHVALVAEVRARYKRFDVIGARS